MSAYTIQLTLTVEVDDRIEAQDMAFNALEHLYDTFNDDGSLAMGGSVEVLP